VPLPSEAHPVQPGATSDGSEPAQASHPATPTAAADLLKDDIAFLMGKAAMDRQQYSLAAALFETAANSDPTSGRAFRRLGFCRFMLGDYAAAAEALERAVECRPTHIQSLVMSGMSHYTIGQSQKGRAQFQRALRLEPVSDFERAMLGQIRLLLGDHSSGWKLYERRWFAPQLRAALHAHPAAERPHWDGTPAPDKTLFLVSEGGFGDVLMFARFIPRVAERVRGVVLIVPTPLERLMQRLPGLTRTETTRVEIPEDALYASLWTLAAVLDVTEDTLAADGPYLSTPERGPDLGPRTAPRVGIVWAGGTKTTHDRDRSCPDVRLLQPLLEVPGIEWVSLQVGERAEEADGLPIRPTPPVKDFSDTSFVISQLDLVITVDTAVAHLAGGLGAPTWILVPTVPEFRWLLDREDCPWYPSARLFRRRHTGDWPGVVDRVADALRQWRNAIEE
jgi:hypothetical protein